MRRLVPLLAGVLLALAPPANAATPAARIEAKGLAKHLATLQAIAVRHGGARVVGTSGERATARYATRTLRAAGWRVRSQPFRFPYFWERSKPTLAFAGGRAFTPGADFAALTYSGTGSVDGPLRGASNGCEASDFEAVVPGEIALVTRGGCLFRHKAVGAERAGAAALIVMDTSAGMGAPAGSLLRIGVRIPALVVSLNAAQQLQAAAPVRVRVAVDAISEERRSANVLAELPRARTGRVVMAGAHLDSAPGSPGVNSDGSGIAALLEVGRSLAGRTPGARVRLAFWGAEEPGLFGSTTYVSALDLGARKRIAAYLNLDVIGSPAPKRGVYSGGDAGIEALLRRLVGPQAVAEDQDRARSGHTAFVAAGIPTGGLFTGAGAPWDPCYRQACDTLSNVNLEVLAQLTRVSATALARLARQAK